MRRKHRQMSSKEITLALRAIGKAGKAFEDSNGTAGFIENVLTEGERVLIGRRMVIAQMILQGLTYYEINEQLQVSPNTFTKVKKWLSGQMPDYETVLKEAKDKQTNAPGPTDRRMKQKIDPFSLRALKIKYPMHFLLLTLFDELRK